MHVEIGIYALSEYFYNGDYTFYLFHVSGFSNLLYHAVNHYDVVYDKCISGSWESRVFLSENDSR